MSFWLRHETKDNEKRTLLTPTQVKALVDKGVEICVEKSETRIFKDLAYQEVGATLVETNSWKTAPKHFYILGLKELPEEDFDLIHKHIQFAHVFKGQDGHIKTLSRFKNGGGTLFDLEYLVDKNQKRIAAFGKWAGFVGTALAIDAFLHKQLNDTDYPALTYFESSQDLIAQIKTKLKLVDIKPRPIVIGFRGRCGSGAMDVINQVGLTPSLWDTKKTKPGGPFEDILDHHILINAALITKKIPPFINESILNANQTLSMISDIGCDPTSELNPIPLYSNISSFEKPFIKYSKNNINIDILAVDNLPTVLPKESSEDFSEQLFPYLLDLLDKGNESPVWKEALNTYNNAITRLS